MKLGCSINCLTIALRAFDCIFIHSLETLISCKQTLWNPIITFKSKASGFTDLFSGQFNTEDYSAFTEVK